jgi:hypothetical protein
MPSIRQQRSGCCSGIVFTNALRKQMSPFLSFIVHSGQYKSNGKAINLGQF